jgi:hypothetical protein
MITSSLSPISVTSVVRSSSTHGLSSEFTRVQSWVSPKSVSLAIRTRPSRAASLRSAGMASSRFPSRTSACSAMSGTFAAIFSFDPSKKWIIREGRKGISRSGSGASIARGLKKSRGFLMGGEASAGCRIAAHMSDIDGSHGLVTDRRAREASGARQGAASGSSSDPTHHPDG